MLRVHWRPLVFALAAVVCGVDGASAAAPNADAARAAEPQAKAAQPKAAQPTAAEKLLRDIDRRAVQLFDSADSDKDGSLSAVEQTALKTDGEKAAEKLAKARNIPDSVLLKLSRDAELAKDQTEGADPAPDSAIAKPAYLQEFRGLVKTAAEKLNDERAAKLAGAHAQGEEGNVAPPPQPVVQQPPIDRRVRNDSRQERRLRDELRQTEYELSQLRLQQQREQYRQAIEQQRRQNRSELERAAERREANRPRESPKDDKDKARRGFRGFER